MRLVGALPRSGVEQVPSCEAALRAARLFQRGSAAHVRPVRRGKAGRSILSRPCGSTGSRSVRVMALSDITESSSVLRAVEEFDSLGREAFLHKYGFGKA